MNLLGCQRCIFRTDSKPSQADASLGCKSDNRAKHQLETCVCEHPATRVGLVRAGYLPSHVGMLIRVCSQLCVYVGLCGKVSPSACVHVCVCVCVPQAAAVCAISLFAPSTCRKGPDKCIKSQHSTNRLCKHLARPSLVFRLLCRPPSRLAAVDPVSGFGVAMTLMSRGPQTKAETFGWASATQQNLEPVSKSR